MNYIFLDLEWNSAYSVRHKRFINEIVQIGAVKMNSELEITDSFCVTVKSCLTKKLSNRFVELTGITNDDMNSGVSFCEAVEKYNIWADSDNAVTLTYSDSDLYAIYDNCKSLLKGKNLEIIKYANLQTMVQGYLNSMGFGLKNQISLIGASELLNIDISRYDMHTAIADSFVAAEVFRKCFGHFDLDSITVDATSPDFFKRLTYKARAINDINSPLIDKKKLVFYCENCGSKARRKTKWKFSNRWFKADFVCDNCLNEFSGRVCFKKTYDDVVFKSRIVYPKPESEKTEDDMQSMPTKV